MYKDFKHKHDSCIQKNMYIDLQTQSHRIAYKNLQTQSSFIQK